jgi:hypothetical protein
MNNQTFCQVREYDSWRNRERGKTEQDKRSERKNMGEVRDN